MYIETYVDRIKRANLTEANIKPGMIHEHDQDSSARPPTTCEWRVRTAP